MGCCSSGCSVACLGMALVWLLVTSGLLFLSWNKVISVLFKFKPAKFWQALLIVLTLCAFCLPKYAMKKRRGYCGKKGNCPTAQKLKAGPDESATQQ